MPSNKFKRVMLTSKGWIEHYPTLNITVLNRTQPGNQRQVVLHGTAKRVAMRLLHAHGTWY